MYRADVLWIAAASIAVAVVAGILSSELFGRIPHIQDSVAQLFQARIFAGGQLWAPSPPLREFFDYHHMINDGRWYSQYPPGHALLLVPGVWLGAPWLVNPILAGLGVAATGLLARELFGSATARVAVLLGLLSPFLILMAAEFMSHVSGFFALTFFLLFSFRALRTGSTRDGTFAGVFLALAILIRPYAAAAVSLPVLIRAARELYKQPPRLWKSAVLAGAGGLTGILLYGLYNWGTTGNPVVPGYIHLYGPSHGLGFGKGTWGPPHTLLRGLRGAWSTLTALNTRLFGWPLSSLWPLAVALLPLGGRGAERGTGVAARGRRVAARGRRGAARGSDGAARDAGAASVSDDAVCRWGAAAREAAFAPRYLLAAIPASLILFHVFYWYHDLALGPRYVFEALGPILVLSAVGLLRMGEALASWLLPRSKGLLRAAPAAVIASALFAGAFVAYWPSLFRLPESAAGAAPGSPERMASYFQRLSPEFWGVSPQLGRLVEREGLDGAVVITRFAEPRIDIITMRHLWFGSAFAHQRPDLPLARVIYVQDRGAENARLPAAFPGRRIWLYTGTIEGGRLRELHDLAAPRELREPGGPRGSR